MKKVTVLGLLAILAISVHATEPMEGIADEVAAYLAPDTANDAIDNFLADLQGGACPSGGCDGCWWRSTCRTLAQYPSASPTACTRNKGTWCAVTNAPAQPCWGKGCRRRKTKKKASPKKKAAPKAKVKAKAKGEEAEDVEDKEVEDR